MMTPAYGVGVRMPLVAVTNLTMSLRLRDSVLVAGDTAMPHEEAAPRLTFK